MRRRYLATVMLAGIMMTACTSPAPGEVISSETERILQSETTMETAAETTSTSEAVTTAVTTTAEITTEATTEAPKGALDGIKIGLDPGHQAHGNSEQEAIAPGSSQTKDKVTGGAVGVSTGIPEYVTVLEIAECLKDKLEAEGATVYMTRESHDVDISNQERTKMMNDYGVDLMLRIHCDASGSSEAKGVGLFVSESNAIAAQSYAYAEIIQPIVCEAIGAQNRGITQNDTYTGQNWAEVPCIMIECGFLSNPEEDQLLNDEAYQERLAEGICEGVKACFAEREE